MEFDNAFEVPLPPAQAWPVLMNIQGIAPCMPGAQLTEVVDDKSYKGNIAVRLGPSAVEIKLGVVTALIGVPIFLSMIFRERRLLEEGAS